MGLTLAGALRLHPTPPRQALSDSVAFVGAGGKTTAIFQLARELAPPVIVTATTHLGAWQIPLADHHIIAQQPELGTGIEFRDVTLVTGMLTEDDRTQGITSDTLLWLRETSKERGIPLLIEADGSNQNPLKAPAQHEPPIPGFVETVVVVVGLSGLHEPLTNRIVHRPEVFMGLSGLKSGQSISAEALTRVLIHPEGGCKNIPTNARRVALLNQADTPVMQAAARGMVQSLILTFDEVVISSLKQKAVFAAHESVAGIVLAAGESKRFGQPKQLLDWHGQPFVRAVAKTALDAGLSPVIVVTGAMAPQVNASLQDLPATILENREWQSGQASSIRAGLASLPRNTGSVVFLLADQPQITPAVIGGLIETHATELYPIVAPLVLQEQRGNPVLFDRVTFPDLLSLQGDVGGRAIFSKYHVEYMPWHDNRLLLDVDTEQDYTRLIEDDTL